MAPAIYTMIVAGVLNHFYDYPLAYMLLIAFMFTVDMFLIHLLRSKHLATCCHSLTFIGTMVALRECKDLFGIYVELADVMISLFIIISLILLAIAVYKSEN